MPVTITIESKGLTELHQRFRESPYWVKKLTQDALGKSAKSVWNRLRNYTQTVPEPRGDYVRTFRLKRSAMYEVDSAKLEARIFAHGGVAPYAAKVWGYDTQIEIHQGRWWTNKSVAESMRGVIGKHFMEAARNLEKALAGQRVI